MDSSTQTPIFQDSEPSSSTNQDKFSEAEIFSAFDTWQKCYDAINHNNISDPIKDFNFKRQATLLHDFIHFLKEGLPLWQKTLGQDWLNAPCFRWGIQYPQKDNDGNLTGKTIKKALNSVTNGRRAEA